MSGDTKLWLTRQEREAIEQLLAMLRKAGRERRPCSILIRQVPPGIVQVYETVLVNGNGRIDRDGRS